MSNPWLSIPLEGYEGHMALPDVGHQLRSLAVQGAMALKRLTGQALGVPSVSI